jgi:ADP-ribose pyrophosphatase YjhB (NUDIX family)
VTEGTFSVWDGANDVEVAVPTSGSENVMIPVVRVIVASEDGSRLLLQRRGNPDEPVVGLLEIPGGRWRAGERPEHTAVREVREETGIELVSVEGIVSDHIDEHRTISSVTPLVVVAGVDRAFPAIHIVLLGVGRGEPVPEAGYSTDVRWWEASAVRGELSTNRAGFIPSSAAALSVYFDAIDSGT